jgi:CRP-like cAMP-binding protein
VLEGQVEITLALLEQGSRAPIYELAEKKREITVSTVGVGDVFAWSALVPPYKATSNGKALGACKAVAFDCTELRARFATDTAFGYQMMVKIAQVVRDRLHDMHQESLAYAGT